jgi:hypothetical protein
MKQLILFCFIIFLAPAATHAQTYWQQQVDYHIDVSLNDSDKTLDGVVSMRYANHSPDTLFFIWMHCWPNAYKNDRTAFSEQLLGNGRTDFYFSAKQQRGYINRLDFHVDGLEAKMEDHPQYIDIIKVILPKPLPPGGQITLTTPFHEKLPFNFSRGGHRENSYQITQWYPKPAVYDSRGWHPIPYLDQGEFYSEFGSFDVRITVPKTFTVAATGELLDAPGRQESAPDAHAINPSISVLRPKTPAQHPGDPRHQPAHTTTPRKRPVPLAKNQPPPPPPRDTATKTLHYYQKDIHDFAWFADPQFHTLHDTLHLPSGRTIDVYAFYTPHPGAGWEHSIDYIKAAVRFRSALIGEYPYNVVTAVQTQMGSPGGMEYPTITAITAQPTSRELNGTIEHEVGHNWFYGILGTNERRYPWMDEGVNTYYDNRYAAPTDDDYLLAARAVEKTDQPISTTSEDFTADNYDDIAYTKTAAWLKMLEDTLGRPLFDSCMREYFRAWQFKHPYPEDFKAVITATSHRSLDQLFALLDTKGPLPPLPAHRRLKPAFLFDLHHTDSINYLGLAPAIGYNEYDHFMIGVLIHNFNLPPNPIQFFLAPLYATGSHQLNGDGGLFYTIYPDHGLQKLQFALGAARFSTISGTDSSGHQLVGGYYKLTPSIRLVFPNSDPRSTRTIALQAKTYLIGEKMLDNYVIKTADSLYYPTAGRYSFRYLNQLSLDLHDNRALYPYKALLQLQQAASFYRVNFTGNYFFNYEKGGGLDVRLFGARFGYIGSRSASQDLTRFEPKLTAVRGDEDYTYDNAFIGRDEFTGLASQQIMDRDGDLHLRTDLFQGLQGRSDNWVASLNLRTTLPRNIVPEWVPIKVFFDVGTYSEAWSNTPPTSHFLYVGGLELDLFHDVLRIYAPLVYSSDFSNQLRTVPDENTFWKKISFSIDLQKIDVRKLFGNNPL